MGPPTAAYVGGCLSMPARRVSGPVPSVVLTHLGVLLYGQVANESGGSAPAPDDEHVDLLATRGAATSFEGGGRTLDAD